MTKKIHVSTQERTVAANVKIVKTLKEKEFAALVGLSLANLQRRRKRGEVEHLRVGRRILYLIPDHLAAFVDAHRQPIKDSNEKKVHHVTDD